MDGKPSSLSVGDLVIYKKGKEESCHGTVSEVLETGAFVRPTTPQGIRMLRREEWMDDINYVILEVNGESLF